MLQTLSTFARTSEDSCNGSQAFRCMEKVSRKTGSAMRHKRTVHTRPGRRRSSIAPAPVDSRPTEPGKVTSSPANASGNISTAQRCLLPAGRRRAKLSVLNRTSRNSVMDASAFSASMATVSHLGLDDDSKARRLLLAVLQTVLLDFGSHNADMRPADQRTPMRTSSARMSDVSAFRPRRRMSQASSVHAGPLLRSVRRNSVIAAADVAIRGSSAAFGSFASLIHQHALPGESLSGERRPLLPPELETATTMIRSEQLRLIHVRRIVDEHIEHVEGMVQNCKQWQLKYCEACAAWQTLADVVQPL